MQAVLQGLLLNDWLARLNCLFIIDDRRYSTANEPNMKLALGLAAA